MILKFDQIMSRPRRFGKSLLLGSLNALLQGKRGLFKGLWIDSSDYDFPKMPVVMLSMTGSFDSEAVLEQSIKIKLKSAAEIIGIDLEGLISFKDSSPADILRQLVTTLYVGKNNKEKRGIAILIDEYDSPIQRIMDNIKQACINCDVLYDFYSELKSLYEQDLISYIFVTGITKFTQTSFLPLFDNCKDLTLNPEYNDICGFNLDEFDSYFSKYLPGVLEYNKSCGHHIQKQNN
jgi:hypothetical protein